MRADERQRPVTISIAQFNAQDDDKAGNLAKAQHYLDLAGARVAIVSCCRNCSPAPVPSGDAHKMLAEPIPVRRSNDGGRRAPSCDVCDGLVLRKGSDGRIYNTAPVVAPGGDLLGCYRKTHLFDVPNRTDLPPGIMESKSSPGTVQVYDTNLCRFGIGICADIRFPEMFRAYARAGAELILLPTAFLSPRFRPLGFLAEGPRDGSECSSPPPA